MKRVFTTFLLVILATWSFSQERYARANDAFTTEFSYLNSTEQVLKINLGNYGISEVEEEGIAYSVVNFEHGVNTFRKGFAELPMLSTTIQLGSKSDVNFKVIAEDFVDINLAHPMLPSRGTIYRNQDPTSIPYVIDPASMVDAFYPENIVEGAEPFIF